MAEPYGIMPKAYLVGGCAAGCLFYRPVLVGYDGQKTLSYQTTLFGPIGADTRQ